MTKKRTAIDECLCTLSGDKPAALNRLHRTTRKIVPKTEECISYGIPAFGFDGVVVAGFAATKKGARSSSGSTFGTLAADLEGYEMTKSSLHFTPTALLPTTLIRKQARIAAGKAPGR